MKTQTGFVLAAAVSLSALAAPPEPYENYVELLTSDTSTAANSMQFGANWSDKTAPDGEHDYYVPNGKTIYTPSSGQTTSYFEFPGRTLACGGYLCNNTSAGFGVTNLVMLPGFDTHVGNNSANYGGGANKQANHDVWTVKGTAEQPAKFSILWAYGATTINFYAKVVGDADACLVAYRQGNPYTPEMYYPGGSLWFAVEKWGSKYYTPDKNMQRMYGSFEEFFGTFSVATNTTVMLSNSSTVMPGTLSVESGAYLRNSRTSGTFTVGTLKLHENATTYSVLSASGGTCVYVVTNKFERDEKPFKVSFENTSYDKSINSADKDGVIKIKLFTLRGEATNSVPELSDVPIDALYKNTEIPLKLIAEQDGDDVSIYATNVTGDDFYLTTGCGSNNNLTSAFYPANGSYWLGGVVPTAESSVGRDHYVFATMQYNSGSCGGKYFFPESDLYVYNNAGIYCQAYDIQYRAWHFYGPTWLYSYHGAEQRFYGDMYPLTGSSMTFCTFQKGVMNVKGRFLGDGGVTFSTINKHASPFGFGALEGDNSDFHGKFYFHTYTYAATEKYAACPDEKTGRFLTMNFNSGLNFGGKLATTNDAWQGVRVDGHSLLKFTNDVEVVEPTRGFFVEDCGRFDVAAGKTFALASGLTLKGEFRKTGKGTIALGGTAKFFDASDPAPLAGTNAFNVTAGKLRVDSVRAADGLALTFSDGASLAVDPEPKAELATTGFVTTRYAEPFKSLAADGKVLVEIAPGAAFAWPGVFEVPICTVPAAVAEAKPFRLAHYAGWRGTLSVRDSSIDGAKTVVAKFIRPGTAIIVR